MPITHEWNGTILTITSDSGTSSCDLKGEKGDMGVRGAQGAKGERGELTFADIYPVGSIYISVNGQADPALLFGGVWERLNDVFLLASSSKYGNGTTGGEEKVALTSSDLPSHKHSYTITEYTLATGSVGQGSSSGVKYATSDEVQKVTGSTGGTGGAHNNMPPYLAVMMWKRTA